MPWEWGASWEQLPLGASSHFTRPEAVSPFSLPKSSLEDFPRLCPSFPSRASPPSAPLLSPTSLGVEPRLISSFGPGPLAAHGDTYQASLPGTWSPLSGFLSGKENLTHCCLSHSRRFNPGLTCREFFSGSRFHLM